MADTVLGKVSCVPRGDYNAGTTYYALDIVGYQGGSYLAMKESTGVTPNNDQVNWMQLSGPGLPGADGTDGTDGVTFTPSVSEAGVISWTNDGGEDNPDPVNIMGPQGNPGAAAGFGEATATVDETTGTPSVEVETSGPDTAKVFSFAFSGLKGETGAKGDTGDQGIQGIPGVAAGFGTPTATVDDNVGTPGVTVQASGPDTAKVFSFAFVNLKGETGAQGEKGDTGDTGPQGPEGPQGPKGDTGTGLDIKGTYDSVELLEAAVQSPQQGDMYNVGASAPYTIYMWDETSGTGDWVSQGQLQGAKGDTGPQGPQGEPGTPGAQGPAGADGQPGEDGGYYTPSVDASGNLSWAGSKADMPAVSGTNIRGPQGPAGADGAPGAQGPAGQDGAPGVQGEQGPQGPAGADGQDATINGVNALTLQTANGISSNQSGGTLTIKLPDGGDVGDVLKRTATSAEWGASPSGLPTGGTRGQMLYQGESGAEWGDKPTFLVLFDRVENGTYEANKSFEEIEQAFLNKNVVLGMNDSMKIFTLCELSSSSASFVNIEKGIKTVGFRIIEINGNDTIDEYYFSIELPSQDTIGNVLCCMDDFRAEWVSLNGLPATYIEFRPGNTGLTSGNVQDAIEEVNGKIPNDYVPNTRTINSKPLSSDVTLTAEDVGAGEPATSATVTLTAAGWTGSAAPFSQQVSCSIVAADTAVVAVDVDTPGTDADADAEAINAWALCTQQNPTQGAGTLTFYCTEKPTINIPVKVGVA